MTRTKYISMTVTMMMIIRFALDHTLSWNFIMLAHWNNSSWIDLSLHSYALFWNPQYTALETSMLIITPMAVVDM